MKYYLLLFVFITNLFSYEFFSWNLKDFTKETFFLMELENREKMKTFLENDTDVIVLHGVKDKNIDKHIKLKNKNIIIVDNSYDFEDNYYHTFIVDKSLIMADTIVYPDPEHIWKFPPVLLSVPEIGLSFLSIQINPDRKNSLDITHHSLSFIRAEINSLKNVLGYFYKKGYPLSKIIVSGDFGLDKRDIQKIIDMDILIDDKVTVRGDEYGSFNYNVISHVSSIFAKPYKEILKELNVSESLFFKEFSPYYPVIIKK
jgi:hypothetical protein